jgi:hypothetical protein
MKVLLQFVLKPLLVLLLSAVGGVVCAVAPCYVVPQALTREFCGYKSAPPHFVAQFWVGCVLAGFTASYFMYRRRRAIAAPR